MATQTPRKRKRTPCDAMWCLNHANSLSLKSFSLHFELYDRQYCQARYRTILDKYFKQNAQAILLAELKQWNLSMDSNDFWKKQARSKVISDTHASCSALVDQIIVEETPHVVFCSNNSTSTTASTSISNASTSQNETDRENTSKGKTNNHSHATSASSNPFPPSSLTYSDSDNSDDSSSNESVSPWIVRNINVTNLFRTYQQQLSPADSAFKIETELQEILALSDILFLAPNEHSILKSQVFGLATLHSLCDHVIDDLLQTTDSTEDSLLTDDEFMTITQIIYGIDAKTISIREAKLELLSVSARMTGNKAGVVEGIANLLTKLPRNRLLDLDKIGEVELQTTYYDALLSEIIADQDRNVALRWANKSSSSEESDIRPDAIISTLVQHDFGHPVGFGEVKPGNSSTTKHSLCMDILRLGIVSKRAIDKWQLNGCLAFMVNGFNISFFLVRKQHKHLYTMTEIGAMTVASSLSELHSFASLKNLDLLSKIGHCFWTFCIGTDATPHVESTGMDGGFVVPISDIYAIIDKSRNKARGTASRY